MFDEKWMDGSTDKPIETVEDAVIIAVARATCNNVDSCKYCAIHMYDHSNHLCREVSGKAEDVLRANGIHLDIDDLDDEDGECVQELVYDYIHKIGAFAGKPKPEPEPEKPSCDGTCSTCLHSRMHTSGILFCKSFGNFVHEDGFCYRFASDKIEAEEEAAPQSKVEPKAPESDDGDWIQLPF